MIILPAMPAEQAASWLGILDLYDRLNEGWTLIGGQLVHLHCAERGEFPVRPTNDADTVIDVRADPTILHTFTQTLEDLGFTSAGISAEGRQHRWKRGDASIDVLLPEGIGERASERQGVTGSPTLPTEGGTQALRRTEVVEVSVEGREGFVRRRSAGRQGRSALQPQRPRRAPPPPRLRRPGWASCSIRLRRRGSQQDRSASAAQDCHRDRTGSRTTP
jgi:hypothetical protein